MPKRPWFSALSETLLKDPEKCFSLTLVTWYGQPIPNGTYGFEQVCRQVAKNTSLEPGLIRTAVEEYMQVCMERLLDGFRVEVGNQNGDQNGGNGEDEPLPDGGTLVDAPMATE